MDLPTIERGMAILADHINRIIQEVRASAITSVTGGKFQRTASGTSIQIDPSFGTGGGGSSAPCPFYVSDVSDEENLFVKVDYGEIAGRVPDGMVLGEDYILDVETTGRVYAQIEFNPTTLDISIEPTAIAIFYEPNPPLPNTATKQFSLLATVVVADGKIKSINNGCYTPTPQPCSLAYE